MLTTSAVRRRIFSLPPGELFTTRDFLSYGTRSAVDKALGRLVKTRVIIRLARGVFVKEGSRAQAPTVLEVAIAKARAFGKQIAIYCAELARELGLTSSAVQENIFCVSGSSSSFRYGGTTIHFRRTCPRKMLLGSEHPGKALRALWHLGRPNISRALAIKATLSFGRTERRQIAQFVNAVPGWLVPFLGPGKINYRC